MAVKTEAEILFKASHRYARISARKARLVMDLIRGQNAEKALVRLEYCERRASPMIRKVLESAIANAAQMSGVESANLVVNEAYADEGPTMKRWRPRSMGRALGGGVKVRVHPRPFLRLGPAKGCPLGAKRYEFVSSWGRSPPWT